MSYITKKNVAVFLHCNALMMIVIPHYVYIHCKNYWVTSTIIVGLPQLQVVMHGNDTMACME